MSVGQCPLCGNSDNWPFAILRGRYYKFSLLVEYGRVTFPDFPKEYQHCVLKIYGAVSDRNLADNVVQKRDITAIGNGICLYIISRNCLSAELLTCVIWLPFRLAACNHLQPGSVNFGQGADH